MMENSKIREKNFSENEKNVLFDLVTSKYSDIIDNKKTDGVTLAKKKLAWEEIAVNFNCQNQNGNHSAKQLHDLYDNLKRTARVNLQCDKKNAYKTGGGTFIKKSTPLDQKIVTTLKPQFTPLPNRYDSSTSYIDPQPSCSSKHTPTACNMVTNTVLTYDVVPSGDLQLVTPDSPLFTEDFPEFVETEVEEVISANTDISELSQSQPGAKGMKRKIVGSNSQPAKKTVRANLQ
ncbi:hypothetical protein RN001_001885 [Aquatica leii]|uniref:Regulatory protein zeste n=1 Tax=Aquatica leii TaxID=1421715 RepID=A0AAN7SLJ2_9COLE|nr:hypothetical protein RN001_001885 [Aquatica leii]